MLSEEGYISLARAASRFPGHRGAERLHPATLTRWILKGARGLDGRRVRLEADRVGSRWLTSEPALRRFTDALGGSDDSTAGVPGPSHPRSPTSRQKASARAAAALRAMGA